MVQGGEPPVANLRMASSPSLRNRNLRRAGVMMSWVVFRVALGSLRRLAAVSSSRGISWFQVRGSSVKGSSLPDFFSFTISVLAVCFIFGVIILGLIGSRAMDTRTGLGGGI